MRVAAAFASGFNWLPALVLFGFLMGVSVFTTRSSYAAVDLILLGLLYISLAVVVSGLGRRLARRGVWFELAGALSVGGMAAWHLREQLRPAGIGPTLWTVVGMAEFAAIALAAGAVQFLLVRLIAASPSSDRRSGRRSVAGSIVFAVVLVVSYNSSETFRWHVLGHNRLIGTPAFHLLSPRVAELEESDWELHRGGDITQPDWLHSTHRDRRLFETKEDAVGSENGGGTVDRRSPDVVVILLDTLRADALEAYGGDPSLMPRLNALADTALVFTDVLANSSWTRPSVASLFTGLAPEEHGAVGWPYSISPEVATMAEVFKRRGYETAAFVANHEAVNSRGGFDRGFDHFEPLQRSDHTYDRADIVTDRVTEWITQPDRKSGERSPLFLYIHYLDPHVPYLSSGPARTGVVSPDEAWDLYGAELRFLDIELERLFSGLDLGLSGPRVTFVTSDHGEEFGEHDARGHGQTLYAEVLDVPALLWVEDSLRPTPRGIVNNLLEGRDFFELLLRTAAGPECGVRPLSESLGRSLRAASVSSTKDPGLSSAVHYLLRPYRHHIYARMVQRDGWKLIWSAYGPTRELYDLSTDPAESNNQVSARPEIAESLTAEMASTPPYWSRPVPIAIPEESLERLRGLGYIR